MSCSDPGPYVSMDGPDIWVPRTVPYLEARGIAKTGLGEWDDRLVYVGKEDADLLGFVRDCRCEETCERRYRWDDALAEDVETGDYTCRVPAWRFRSVER